MIVMKFGGTSVEDAHAMRNVASIVRRTVEPARGAFARALTAESIWRGSGGRSTTSARSRVNGHVSKSAPRRCSAIAARATQPPRPFRSRTTSPGFVQASIAVTSSAADAGGASRSKTGSDETLASPGSGFVAARPTMPQL